MPLDSDAQLTDLVAAFEGCTLPHEGWTHEAHLMVAAVYTLRFSANAPQAMREGIQRFNAHHRIEQNLTGGYHESLTMAWMRLVKDGLEHTNEHDETWRRINVVAVALSDKRTILNYYSRQAIMSPAARFGWLEPDLAPLP